MSTVSNRFSPHTIHTYQYWALVERIVDGDTLDLKVALGFDIEVSHRFRLKGINAPEIFSHKKGTPEREAGNAARDFLVGLVPEGSWIEVRVFQTGTREKYGRWLAEIFVGDLNVNERLVSQGHAVNLES